MKERCNLCTRDLWRHKHVASAVRLVLRDHNHGSFLDSVQWHVILSLNSGHTHPRDRCNMAPTTGNMST